MSNCFEQKVIKNLSNFCEGLSRFLCKVVFTMFCPPLEITENLHVVCIGWSMRVASNTRHDWQDLIQAWRSSNTNTVLFLIWMLILLFSCLLCDSLVHIDVLMSFSHFWDKSVWKIAVFQHTNLEMYFKPTYIIDDFNSQLTRDEQFIFVTNYLFPFCY